MAIIPSDIGFHQAAGQVLWPIAGIVVSAIVGSLVKSAINVFSRYTAVKLTEQQQAAVMTAAETAAGTLLHQVALGQIKVSDVAVSNYVKAPVNMLAQQAIEGLENGSVHAPPARIDSTRMSEIIVGRFGLRRAAMMGRTPTVAAPVTPVLVETTEEPPTATFVTRPEPEGKPVPAFLRRGVFDPIGGDEP